MSWDERYAELRAELRAAQREVDTLSDPNAGVEQATKNRRAATLRKSLMTVEKEIRAMAQQAGGNEDMNRRLDMAREQRGAILDKLSMLRADGGGSLFSGIKKAIGFGEKKEEEPEMFDDKDDAMLLDMQNEAITEQDEALSRLHTVIVRQKEVGQSIGNELEAQDEVIQRLDDGVQRSTAAVRSENSRMKHLLDASSRDSRLTILIIILLIAFLVVIIMALK